MSKKKHTPSTEVDQKKLVDDKAAEMRNNQYEDDHVRNITINGANGQ